MQINWTIRFKNPVWWAQTIASIVLPVLAYFGLNWEDMTSWGVLFDVLFRAIQNPVVLLLMLHGAFNALNDPTTSGLCDSKRALNYKEPYKEG